MKNFVKRKLLGIDFSIASEKQVLEYTIQKISSRDKKFYVVTPNPEILVMANRNGEYKKVLNKAKLALPDGAGIIWASKILGISLKEKITGIDLVQNLCKAVARQPITVGFLGSREGVAVKTAECLKKIYPSLKVKFASSELDQLDKLDQCDILFVALGSPKQELWIARNIHKLPVKAAIGVGGAFDMISGEVPRAPVFVQNLGLEWFFRLIIQPWRIKRQMRLLKFIYLVLKEKFS